MKTIQLEVNVTPDRQLMIQLPEDIQLGKHQLILVMHPEEESKLVHDEGHPLNNLAGKIQSFKGVDAVNWQREVRDE